VNVGDPVTVVHHDHTIRPSTVAFVEADRSSFMVEDDAPLVELYDAHREGITWISGHHETNSPEIRSLAAAYLLAELPAGDSSA